MFGSPPPLAAATLAAPTWLNAQTATEPLPWPSTPQRFPVEDYYADLLAEISPTSEDDRTVSAWLPLVRERLAEVLRPHVLDVDILECGSFATGTHLSRPQFDIDVVARLHSLEGLDNSPLRLLDRIRDWISHGLDADVTLRRGAIVIADRADGDAGLRVRVIPCAPRDGTLRPVATVHEDPVAHRDRILARDHALGGDSVMRRSIRIAKHVNALHSSDDVSAVTSHEIECVALATLVCPATVGDSVAALLASIAALVRTRSSVVARDRRATGSTFESAAQAAERAMGTFDRQVVFKQLDAVFAPGSSEHPALA